jgi:alkanesulfonate monooxygenase SsuD/methylene tetrahydromethanopterin reductase-like flavin-dependent oxidoreductase (luciferase family)
MYPGRFVLGVGTGEAMNEFPFFERWPDWKERMERLIEGTEFMRKLWNGNSYFDFSGKYFRAKQVYLYTKPRTLPRVHFSAVGIKSARFAGTYGDGLITVSSRNPIDRCRDLIFPSFDEGAKSAGRDPSKMDKIVLVSFSFDDPKKYVQTRRVHAGPLAKGSYDEPDPRKIEKMGSQLSDEEILRSTFFCSGWPEVIDLVAKFQEIGMTQAVFYSGPDKEKIRTFAKHILPHFRKRKPRK